MCTESAIDYSLLEKRVFDFFLIGPNYKGLMDTTANAFKAIDKDFTGCITYGYIKVSPRKYPMYHCYIDDKLIFFQSSIDEFVSNRKVIELFNKSEIKTKNGRNRFMKESMGIIKFPNGSVKTFMVNDTVLTEDMLREQFKTMTKQYPCSE